MTELLSIGQKVKGLNAISILTEILQEPSTKEFFIKLNTRDQLFDKGEDRRGIKLSDIGGGYSANTIEGVQGVFEGKKQKGLPFNRVTLSDTFAFYDSWEIIIQLPFVIFQANDVKDGVRLTEEWGKDIIGLNEENKIKAEGFLLEKYLEKVLSIVFG